MRRLTIERAGEIIIFVLLFALATRIPLDTDTWWHLRSGEYTVQNGIIYADPFSHTMQGQSWTNHSWGAQIILYAFWRVGGDAGLAIYTALLATAGMYVIYKMGAGSVYARAFALVLGAATAAVFWSPRPQMLSFFLSAVLLYILYLHKYQKVDRLWLLPPLFALWGNLHAGFSIGFIFLGGSIVGESLNMLLNREGEHNIGWRGIRKLIVVGIVSVAALLINPYGVQMLLVPFQTLSIGVLRDYIQEWNRPDLLQPQTLPFLALLISTPLLVLWSRQRLDWTDAVLFVGAALMGLLAGRNIAVFAVAATPIFSRALDAALRRRGWVIQPLKRVSPRMRMLNAVLVAFICFGALAKVLYTLDPMLVAQAKDDALPLRAATYLRDQLPDARMFNSYNWGGYLMFAAPAIPVFVDGRTDLYGDALLTRYLDVASGGDWQSLFDEYGVDTVVIEADSPLVGALGAAGWTTAYEDEQAMILRRERGA
jgi:hypothetical protein